MMMPASWIGSTKDATVFPVIAEPSVDVAEVDQRERPKSSRYSTAPGIPETRWSESGCEKRMTVL
jgi:hypothetical protein